MATSSSAVLNAAEVDALPVEERQRRLEAYLRKHGAERLGLGADFSVPRLTRGAYQPVQGSDALALIAWHLDHPEGQKAPKGYRTFVGLARADPVLSSLMQLSRTTKRTRNKTGNGIKQGAGGGKESTAASTIHRQHPSVPSLKLKKQIKKKKNATKTVRFRFKPHIWH